MNRLVLLLITCVISITQAWATPSGDGSLSSPYCIAKASDLVWFQNAVNRGENTYCVKLTADINMSTVCSASLGSWTPIGTDFVYTGTFDGDGSNKELKVTFNNINNSLNCTRYATTGKTVYQFPAIPANAARWASDDGNTFYSNTIVTADITLTAAGMVPDTDGTYLIGSASELAAFRNMVNEGQNTIRGKLTADIDLSSECGATKGNWTPIGNESNNYGGKFDGDGHTISNLYINAESQDQGLFGYAQGVDCVIKNVTVNGNVASKSGNIGGIIGTVGYPDSGTIENCVNYCTVEGINNVGGIAGGIIDAVKILNCTNNGNVIGTGECIGGVVGYVKRGSSVSRCKNTGTVTNVSKTDIGGIAGTVSSNGGGITESINTGTIVGSGATGGICGNLYWGTISNCLSTASNISSVKGTYLNYATYEANAGAIVGVKSTINVTINNCHYLNTVAITEDGSQVTAMGVRANGKNKDNTKNESDTDGVTAGDDASAFSNGEVAYLLNTAFGQILGTDAIPTLLGDYDSNKVLKANVYRGTETAEVNYTNWNGNGMTLSGNHIAMIEDSPVDIASLGVNMAAKYGDQYKANSIKLEDGKPFYTPCEIIAKEAEFTPTLKPLSNFEEKEGWVSNALMMVPFEGLLLCDGQKDKFTLGHNYFIKSFNGVDSYGKVKLVDGNNNGKMPANTPLYLAITTNQPDANQVITISGTDVTVLSAVPQQQSGDLTMMGTYTTKELTNVYQFDATRRNLELKTTATINPFEAYFLTTAVQPATTLEFAEGSIPTGADTVGADASTLKVWAAGSQLMIMSPEACTVNIYTMNGVKVKQVELEAGKTVVDNMAAGMYLVNSTKVVIR